MSPLRVCRHTLGAPPAESAARGGIVHPDRGHTLEAMLIVDEDPASLLQDGGVGAVPGHAQTLSDPGDGEVLDDDARHGPNAVRPGTVSSAAGPPQWCPASTHAHTPNSGSDALATRSVTGLQPEGSWARRRTTVSRGIPSHPHSRHHRSSSTTRQATSQRSGRTLWPTTTRPRSSTRANVVRSGRVKVAWDTSGSFRWAV